MGSFNSIEKIKYTDSLSDAVSLDEYIVFGNEKSEEKYIVFRFSNNVDQKLIGMKFEVSQYDMHDNLIEKSVVIYNNFHAKANATFVPKAKLKVLYACKRISVTLLQAAFDRVMWNEGEYIDNSYKFEHYARDEKYIEEKDRPVPPKTVPTQLTKTQRLEQSERFLAKNITKKNIAVFPAVYYWLVCIFLVIALGVTIFLYPKFTKVFTVENYEVEIISGEDVRIRGCEAKGDSLVVPERVGQYRVAEIGKGAFNRLTVKTVLLPSSITSIEAGAFKHMSELRSVTSLAPQVTVAARAFDGLKNLTTVEIAGAVLSKNCLYGCSAVSGIQFSSTSVAKFIDLFGESKHGATVRYFVGNYPASESFFDGATYEGA